MCVLSEIWRKSAVCQNQAFHKNWYSFIVSGRRRGIRVELAQDNRPIDQTHRWVTAPCDWKRNREHTFWENVLFQASRWLWVWCVSVVSCSPWRCTRSRTTPGPPCTATCGCRVRTCSTSSSAAPYSATGWALHSDTPLMHWKDPSFDQLCSEN